MSKENINKTRIDLSSEHPCYYTECSSWGSCTTEHRDPPKFIDLNYDCSIDDRSFWDYKNCLEKSGGSFTDEVASQMTQCHKEFNLKVCLSVFLPFIIFLFFVAWVSYYKWRRER